MPICHNYPTLQILIGGTERDLESHPRPLPWQLKSYDVDGKGRPLGFVLTPGEAHDVNGFGPLFWMNADEATAIKPPAHLVSVTFRKDNNYAKAAMSEWSEAE